MGRKLRRKLKMAAQEKLGSVEERKKGREGEFSQENSRGIVLSR
jgi:hypothetical protein